MLNFGGLNGFAIGQSPTFTGTVTADNFIATGTTINFTMATAGRLYYQGVGGNYLTAISGTGHISGTSGFTSNIASGSNAFLAATAGARLKFSSGGTTDYLSGNGSTLITAAGDLTVAGSLTASGGMVVPGGNHVYLAGGAVVLDYATSSVVVNSTSGNLNLLATGGKVIASGDATSPVKAAFQIVPQDAEPTGANSVGDMYMTTAGALRICTVAGTPGTWTTVTAI